LPPWHHEDIPPAHRTGTDPGPAVGPPGSQGGDCRICVRQLNPALDRPLLGQDIVGVFKEVSAGIITVGEPPPGYRGVRIVAFPGSRDDAVSSVELGMPFARKDPTAVLVGK